MTIQEQLRYTPWDLVAPAGDDLTGQLYRAVRMGPDSTVRKWDLETEYQVFVGILQNEPTIGQDAVVRPYGYSLALYGDYVYNGDFLWPQTYDGADDGRMRPFVNGRDGHRHISSTGGAIRVRIKVTLAGVPVTGLATIDFAGSTVNAFDAPYFMTDVTADGYTVYDVGGGTYFFEFYTNTWPTKEHIFDFVAGANTVTPNSAQTATWANETFAPTLATSKKLIIAQAIQDGIADEPHLVFIQKQLY